MNNQHDSPYQWHIINQNYALCLPKTDGIYIVAIQTDNPNVILYQLSSFYLSQRGFTVRHKLQHKILAWKSFEKFNQL